MINLNDSIKTFSDYRLEDNGSILFEPCFCITLFSIEMVTKTHVPESLLTPYRKFLEAFGSSVNRILFDGNQKHGVKITDERLNIPYDWLADSRKRIKDNAFADIYFGTANKLERKLPRLDWYYKQATPEINQPASSYYRILLPLNWLAEQGLKGVEAFIREIIGDFPLSFGYAGFALSFNGGEVLSRKDLEYYLGQWLERHPGIMSPDPSIESQWASKTAGITSIGWITFLGTEFTTQTGGHDELKRRLALFPDIQVTPFIQQGTMIRIGEAPILGDTFHNNLLDNYHAVENVLSPLHKISKRLKTDYLHVTGIKGKEAREKWFNRFFI
ncbi:type VI immunity family protein [Salmonella bongori]|uniref:type VI immunity family protein n=1 Tax=Salmonella bongori TaxID=54736 RepID=UPI0015588EE0|nr:type VI immunity family protein [Salmonella bongori]